MEDDTVNEVYWWRDMAVITACWWHWRRSRAHHNICRLLTETNDVIHTRTASVTSKTPRSRWSNSWWSTQSNAADWSKESEQSLVVYQESGDQTVMTRNMAVSVEWWRR